MVVNKPFDPGSAEEEIVGLPGTHHLVGDGSQTILSVVGAVFNEQKLFVIADKHMEDELVLPAPDMKIPARETADQAIVGADFPTQVVFQIGREDTVQMDRHFLL